MDEAIDFGESQLGDMSAGDVSGGNFTKISVSSDQAIKLLSDDLVQLRLRIEILERTIVQHTQERQALTRMLTMLATEARTVGEMQDLIERQLAIDQERQRYLYAMLITMISLFGINITLKVSQRVFRRIAA